MPVRRLLALAVLACALALPPSAAQAQVILNPCDDPQLRLRCPDLTMEAPRDFSVQRAGKVTRLRARNAIVNVGQGPMEVRAVRGAERLFAPAHQVIHRRGGGFETFPEAGWVYFKFIPGQGRYWKYAEAARFELWTLDAQGRRDELRRVGPKLSYCFRDLDRVRTWARVPKGRVYPACSMTGSRREMRLGTSVGWADVYPASYHENWISITGLRGCFAFVHRADPADELIEEREDNNLGVRKVRLPARNGRIRGC